MSTVTVKKIGITRLDTDAIVNAANEGLWEGGGVCGAIFREAGSSQLTKACNAIGGCKTGCAVITPGFDLKAKYIIHAVGPRWTDGEHGEPSLLYDAYKTSLELAKENGCHSIGFPLISAGIFGYPKKKAWRKAIQACNTFMKKNPDYDIDIIFAVLDDEMLNLGQKTIDDIINEKEFDEAERIPEVVVSDDVKKKAEAFCRKYEILLQALSEDDDLSAWCKECSVYSAPDNMHQLRHIIIHNLNEDAYNSGTVIQGYDSIIKANTLDKEDIENPTEEWIKTLSKEEIIACISYHFRMDHFSDSLFSCSIAEGHLYKLVKGYIEKCN